MKKEIKLLLDFQKFQKNKRLEVCVAAVNPAACTPLSDADMAFVSAAGAPAPRRKNQGKD